MKISSFMQFSAFVHFMCAHPYLYVSGFKAPSPLLQLPNFDIVRGVVIDAMHCAFLGVVKQLVCLWLNSKNSGSRRYCAG